MSRIMFFTLKIICFLCVLRPSATSTAPPAETQLIPVSASAPQSTCKTLNAVPLAAPNQKDTWVVGRATRRQGQTDVNQNDCRLNNFGQDCDAMQISITLRQDGLTRDVSVYAYNTRTDTVLYRAGEYVLLDSNYEVYREETETKMSINRDGAALMAASPSQPAAQSFDFAKVAESKDLSWALFASCDQTLAWVMFHADLLTSDPQATFVEHYRRSIDDTLGQFNINPSNLVEVKLTFPFLVPEIPGYEDVQQPPAVQMQTNYNSAAAPTAAVTNPAPAPTVSYPSTVYVAYRSSPAPPPTVAANPTFISSDPIPPPASPNGQSAKKSAVYYTPSSTNVPAPPSPSLASVPASLPLPLSPLSPPAPLPPPTLVSIPPPSQYNPPVTAPVTSESFPSPSSPPSYIQYSPPASPPMMYTSTPTYEVAQPPPPPPPPPVYASPPALPPPAPPVYASPPAYAPAIPPPTVLNAPPTVAH